MLQRPVADPIPPPALQATPAYAAALRLSGVPVRDVDLMQDGAVIGRAQVVLRRFAVIGTVAWLPLGPVWDGPAVAADRAAALDRLARALPTTGARVWISAAADAAADADYAAAGHLPLMPGAVMARLDLRPDPVLLRRGLHGKWRNALVRGEAAAMRLHHTQLPIDPGHWLLRAEGAQRRRRGYRAWPIALTLAYARANPGDARLFWAERGGERIAGIVVLRHGAGATYHLGWSGPEGRRLAAHQVLLWQAIRWLNAEGTTQLDLGRIDPDHAPGLARFKLGTGARRIAQGRTWLHQPLLRAVTGRSVEPLAFCRIAV